MSALGARAVRELCGCGSFAHGHEIRHVRCNVHAAAPLMLEALEALKALEWSGVDAIEAVTFRSCPSCGAPEFALDDEPREHGQHMQDCMLGAAIAAAEGM